MSIRPTSGKWQRHRQIELVPARTGSSTLLPLLHGYGRALLVERLLLLETTHDMTIKIRVFSPRITVQIDTDVHIHILLLTSKITRDYPIYLDIKTCDD